MGARVNAALGIGTSATHMEWFFGPKGLRFSEIGCRPPGVGAWDLYSAGNDIDLYREWANAIVHDHVAVRPSRRFATGIVALRPDRDGTSVATPGSTRPRAGSASGSSMRTCRRSRHPDPTGRGRLLGQRLRPDATPRLRRVARHARRRGPHGARVRLVTSRASALPDVEWPVRRLILLGPQRRPTVDAVLHGVPAGGPIGTVTAGWQEREPDDAELDALLGGRSANLRLYARWLDVLEQDPEYATAEREHRAALDERQELYLVQLGGAARCVAGGGPLRRRPGRDPGGRRGRRGGRAAAGRPAASAAGGRGRRRVRGGLAAGGAGRGGPPPGRGARAGGRGPALVVAGGHVGVLLPRAAAVRGDRSRAGHRLVGGRHGADRAGAAVPRQGPAGPGARRVRRGRTGLAARLVLLPHARRRLRTEDLARMAELAARAAPARCVVLDDGTRLDLAPTAARCPRTPASSRPTAGSARSGREPAAGHQPAQGPPARRGGRRPVPGPPPGADRGGGRCTFLCRGQADEVHLVQRIVGLPERMPLRRLWRHRPLVAGAGAARPGPGWSTSSRSAAASTPSASTTRSTPSGPTARSAGRRCASRTATSPRTGRSTTRRPVPASWPRSRCRAGRCAATAR